MFLEILKEENINPNFKKPTLILYHAKCPDGFACAWLYWKMFGDSIIYTPFNHDDTLPNVEGHHVLMIDVSTNENRLEKLKESSLSFRLLDHHHSAKNKLNHLSYTCFDLSMSGIGLAWNDIFNKKEELPFPLTLIQKRDLHQELYPDEIKILHYLDSLHYCFNKWDLFFDSLQEDGVLHIKNQGAAIEQCLNTMAKKLILNSRVFCQQGYKGRAVNASVELAPNLFSGLKMMDPEIDFAFIWSMDSHGVIWASWRSEKINTVALAEEFNGGGNPFASGARMKFDVLSKLLDI